MNKKESGLIEIDLETYDKDLLITLINFAHKYDMTFNQAINHILLESIKLLPDVKDN